LVISQVPQVAEFHQEKIILKNGMSGLADSAVTIGRWAGLRQCGSAPNRYRYGEHPIVGGYEDPR